MISKIRKLLGIESDEERLQRLIKVNESISDLSKSIDEVAEEFTAKNENFKQLLNSGTVNDEIKKSVKSRYDNFLEYQKEDLQKLVKERNSLRDQHKELMKDEKLFKAISDLSFYEDIKKKYKEGEVSLSTFDLLITAKQGKVKYADNIVLNEKGQLLILQRTRVEDDKNGGKWCLPGGHVDAGEEFEEAALRELKEESGICIDEAEEIGVYEDDKAEIHYFKSNVIEFEAITLLQNGETESSKWIDLKDIDQYPMPFNMAENIKALICEKDTPVTLPEKKGSILGEIGDNAIEKIKEVLSRKVEAIEKAINDGSISKELGEELIEKAKSEKGEDKVSIVMKEFAEGKLKSSSGEKVTDKKQALAIAYYEAGLSKGEVEEMEPIEKAYLNGIISQEIFEKSTHKYIKKEPNGKGGWNYIYKESKAALSKLEKNIKTVSKKISKLGVEHLYCFNKEGEKIFKVSDGKEDMVDIPPKFQPELKGSHLVHNHPKGNSFSIYDFQVCLVNQIKTTRIAVNDSKFGEGVYIFENNFEKPFDLNGSLKEIQDSLDEWYNKNGQEDKVKNETIWVEVFKSLSVYKENPEKISIHFEDKDGNKIRL